MTNLPTQYPKALLTKPLKSKADWWELSQSLRVKCDLHPYGRFVIPAGFCSDFASAPQAFWWLIPPHGLSAMPCLVHDYLYEHRTFQYSRRQADMFWYGLMIQAGVPRWQRRLMFAYVRLLGGITWKKFSKPKK